MATWLQQFGNWNTNANASIFGGADAANVMHQASGFGKAMSGLGINAGSIGGIANTIGQIGTGLLAGQNQTGVGNALQTIGGLASNIPGVGGLIGAGVGVVGGLVNAAFGSHINKEFVSQTENQINQLGNRIFNGNTNADLLNDWNNYSEQSYVTKKEVGSDGWFSNKAKKKRNALNEAIDEANERQLLNYNIAVQNADQNTDLRILQGMQAYGGPINSFRKYYAEGGSLFDYPEFFTFEPQTYAKGGYLNQAKALIRQNEGWSAKPYTDSPKGRNWRSVGYGFNDSGFRDKYPEGISKHYEHGITKKQAEEELDYFLNKAEKQLKSIYGKQWNDFTDNQKAAILDTYYQRPASVGKSSKFYKAITAGEDASKYLGVAGFSKRNNIRQSVFGNYSDYAESENPPANSSSLQEVASVTPVVQGLDLEGITPTQAKALELNLTSPTYDLSMFNKPMTTQPQVETPTVGTVEDFLASYGDFEDNLFRKGGNLFEGGGYKIPKKRTKIKTIRTNNGVLTGEVDDNGRVYWFKEGKYITPYQMENYKYYDPDIKGYRKLGDKAKIKPFSKTVEFVDIYNPVHTSTYDKLLNESNRKEYENHKREEQQNIPLQNQKWLTLRTKGKMNLADVPMNMLDSIAVNAGRSGTDFWTDAALIGKESTFGGFSKALNSPYSPTIESVGVHDLTNNHSWFNTPEGDYIHASNKKFPWHKDKGRAEGERDMKYALEHGLVKATTPHYSDYILADAFKRYQAAPTRYNPGQKNYVPMLNGIRQELLGEKQLQEYWNTRGKQEYERGQQEGMASGGKLNIKDMNIFDFGGGLTHGVTLDTGVDWVNEGGSHGENPYGGVMVGSDEKGIPNLVEEDEAIWNGDYVFSRRMKVPKKLREKYSLPEDATFADAVKRLTKESEERPLDNISRTTQDHILGELADSQEELRAAKAQKAMDKQIQLQDDFLTGVQFGLGGGIHIDPSKRGTFKAQASKMGMGVQEAASHILANREDYSPAMVKKANFAKNFAHAFGGSLFDSPFGDTNTFDFGGDLKTRRNSIIRNSGVTEEQANAMLFRMLSKEDRERAVKERVFGSWSPSYNQRGEIIMPTSVTPNRENENSQQIGKGKPSAQNKSKVSASSKNKQAQTGSIVPFAYDWYRNGSDGLGNPTGFTVGKNGLIDKKNGYTQEYRDLVGKLTADDIRKWATEHPDDSSLKSFLARGNKLEDLTTDQWRKGATDGKYGFMHHVAEQKLQESKAPTRGLDMPNGNIRWTEDPTKIGEGLTTLPKTDITSGNTEGSFEPRQTWTRYAPIAMNALFGLKEMLTPADYGNADMILDAAYRAGQPVSVGTEYIGDYRKRDPFDERYLMNIINQRGAAANRNFMNLSGGNRAVAMSGILANDLTTQMSLAEAARQAYLANRADDAQVAEFNRGTNIFNAQAQNTRNLSLAHLNSQRQNAMLSGIAQGARLRQAIKDQRDAAISANLTAFTQGLGDLGKENGYYNMLGGLNDEGILKYFYGDNWRTKFNNTQEEG